MSNRASMAITAVWGGEDESLVMGATKFLGGHAAALGAVCGDAKLVGEIYHYREIAGATLDPMAAYLLIRWPKTLHLRIRQQNESALKIARWLQAHPAWNAVPRSARRWASQKA
jgi:cystathionine gamma-synthase